MLGVVDDSEDGEGNGKSEEVAQSDVMYAKRDDKRAIGAFAR